MVEADQVLLVSEDAGNDVALAHAREKLANGYRVTWLCSTATSASLTALEEIAALKNAHIAELNLLVVTREESQLFATLTGALDAKRLDDCAGLLFDSADISECSIAATGPVAATLHEWCAENLATTPVTTLTVADNGSRPEASKVAAANTVAVTVIMQGRELRFAMQRNTGTLLDGAEDAGIDLPFSCRGGVCSTCRAKLREGEVDLMENYALEDWELAARFTLPCQAEPISPQITLDYDEV